MPSFTKDPPEKIDQKYISENGSNCPFCNSVNICHMRYLNNDSEIECNDCKHIWLECYEITGILITEADHVFLQEVI